MTRRQLSSVPDIDDCDLRLDAAFKSTPGAYQALHACLDSEVAPESKSPEQVCSSNHPPSVIFRAFATNAAALPTSPPSFLISCTPREKISSSPSSQKTTARSSAPS